MSFKNETPDWNDLRLFLAVAKANGLAGAARETGVSIPTLSRRISQLETDFGLQLFKRHKTGFTITSLGKELLDKVHDMDIHAQMIHSWRQNLDPRPIVKITAGTWTSLFISRHLTNLSGSNSTRIELISNTSVLNLLRREADIGIRNKMPDQQGLVRRKLGQVKFAIYGAPKYLVNNPAAYSEDRFKQCDWVISSKPGSAGSSSFWIHQHLGGIANLTCDNHQITLEATIQGAGLAILPCFIGNTIPELEKCSDPIEELTHTQWLVSHEEAKTLPYIRKIKNALFQLFKQHQLDFA